MNALVKAGIWFARGSALVFLLMPLIVLVFLSFSADTFTVIPPKAYSIKWFGEALKDGRLVSGFFVSIKIAAVAASAALVSGTLVAYGHWRYRLLAGQWVETALSLPIIIPTVVTGIALLTFFARLEWYNAFVNIAIGHVILGLPFTFRAVSVAFSRYDRQLDEAGKGLGAKPLQVFFYVTLPQVRTGIFAGGLFAFILSFDDFNISAFLIDTDTIPLPVSMYQYLYWLLDPTLTAVSAMIIFVTVVGAFLIDRSIGLAKFVGVET